MPGGATFTREKNATIACRGGKRRSTANPRSGRSGFAGCIRARFSMLDIALIRRDPERVRNALVRRGQDPSPVDELLRYDEEYRSALTAVERAKAEKNRLSAAIGEAVDKAAAAREYRPKIDELSTRIDELEERARLLSPTAADSPLRALLDNMPNLLDDSVPRRHRRDRQRRGAALGRAAPRSSSTPQAALGDRRAARHSRFRPALRNSPAAGSRCCGAPGRGLPRALASFFLDRAAARGYLEDRAAAARLARDDVVDRTIEQVLRRNVLRSRRRPVHDSNVGGSAHRATLGDEILECRGASAEICRVYALLSQRGRRRRERHARLDASASVREGRTRLAERRPKHRSRHSRR